jgi:hypothetical protein
MPAPRPSQPVQTPAVRASPTWPTEHPRCVRPASPRHPAVRMPPKTSQRRVGASGSRVTTPPWPHRTALRSISSALLRRHGSPTTRATVIVMCFASTRPTCHGGRCGFSWECGGTESASADHGFVHSTPFPGDDSMKIALSLAVLCAALVGSPLLGAGSAGTSCACAAEGCCGCCETGSCGCEGPCTCACCADECGATCCASCGDCCAT